VTLTSDPSTLAQDLTASSPPDSSLQNLTLETEAPTLSDSVDEPSNCLTWQAELQIFLSTFFTIFLAEVGDKTQLTVLLMSAESGSPWTVFVGAGAALVATSLCGVLLGRWLSTRVSPKVLEKAAAVLLLGIAALLLWDVWQG